MRYDLRTSSASTPRLARAATGYFCVAGSASPQACSAGSYQNVTGASSCAACPPGYYCPAGAISPTICPPGSVCPAATQAARQTLCPAGTFSAQSGLRATSQCTACSGGRFCATAGLTAPTGVCDAGFYCVRGVSVHAPAQSFSRGYSCSVGLGIWNATPVPVNGDACPVGYACAAGSSAPTPCPPGSFLNTSRATSTAACQACTPGMTCPRNATTVPRTLCPSGYVCSGGNVNGLETPCPLGHTCGNGTAVPVPCAPGSYANLTGLAACKACPSRFYCLLGQINPTPCPAGAVCGPNSSTAYPALCPAATYSSLGGLALVSECSPCTPGKYCATAGLTAPTGSCAGGFMCFTNATSPTPRDGRTGAVCPASAYCPPSSSSATPCPPGTFSNSTGMVGVANCTACLPGFTCPVAGLVVPTRPCDAGYSCGGGVANVSAALLCPLGNACPSGSAAPVPCAPGLYANVTGRAACLVCPAGYACSGGTVSPRICAPGFACPAASVTGVENPCPVGTFSSVAGLTSLARCSPCSAGMWCGAANLTAPSGPCDAGFFCGGGSAVSAPALGFASYVCASVSGYGATCPVYYNATTRRSYGGTGAFVATAAVAASVGDVCPTGAFCPSGSTAPSACPGGSFLNSTRGTAASACQACLAGWLCPKNGSAVPTALCPSGSSCPGGQIAAGLRCPPGSSCGALGLAAPATCLPGSFQDVAGQTACKTCNATNYCPNATIVPLACPAGFACPLGTASSYAAPCPNGTYLNRTASASLAACSLCPGGLYCAGTGLAAPTGSCAAGFYCTRGATTPTPVTGATGGVCPSGYWCGSGSAAPTTCLAGTFSGARGNTQPSQCEACTPGMQCPTPGLSAPSRACLGGL